MDTTIEVYKGIDQVSQKPKKPASYQNPFLFEIATIDIEEFAAYMAFGGYCKAAVYDQKKACSEYVDKNDLKIDGFTPMGKVNAKYATFIGLDFDDCKSDPYTVCKEFEEDGLAPNFFYYTFSQDAGLAARQNNENLGNFGRSDIKKGSFEPDDDIYNIDHQGETAPKIATDWNFRIIWALPEQLPQEEYECTYKALLDYIKEKGYAADDNTKDISRIWWGGKLGYELFHKKKLDVRAWVGIQKYYERYKALTNATPSKVYKVKDFDLRHLKEVVTKDKVTVQEGWVEKLAARAPLMQKFINHEYLPRKERWHLETNLAFLQRADKNKSIIKDVLAYYDPTEYIANGSADFSDAASAAKEMQHAFKTAQYATPIVADENGVLTMTAAEFFQLNPDYTQVPMVRDKSDWLTLEELDEELDTRIYEVLGMDGSNVFKSQTASGKTERYLQYIVDSMRASDGFRRFVIACPTHNLVEECGERLKSMFNKWEAENWVMVQPPAPAYTDYDKKCLALGIPSETTSHEMGVFINDYKGYDDEIKEVPHFRVYIMTHTLLNMLDYIPADRFIVDEDMTNAMQHEYCFTRAQLMNIRKYLRWPRHMDEFINQLDNADFKVDLHEFKMAAADLKAGNLADYLADNEMDNGLFAHGLFKVYPNEGIKTEEGFRVVISSEFVKNCVEGGSPITIFTATPNYDYLEREYPGKFKIIEAGKARNTGTIIQDTTITGARGLGHKKMIIDLTKIKYRMEFVHKRDISDFFLLTYKLTDEEIDYAQELGFKLPYTADGNQVHIDNSVGLDLLKAKKVIYYGKRDYPEEFYKRQFEDIFGVAPAKDDLHRSNIRVDYGNGCVRSVNLYENKELREVQLNILHSVQTQGIGRARSLREDTEVYVFSNIVEDDVDVIY